MQKSCVSGFEKNPASIQNYKHLEIPILIIVTEPGKIDHVSAKKITDFSVFAVYTSYLNNYLYYCKKSSSLLQNLMGFPVQLTEIG